MNVHPVVLDAGDATELAELLEFLTTFLDDHHHTIAPALDQFTASCYSVDELRADLARFAFLLGGNGERFVLGES